MFFPGRPCRRLNRHYSQYQNRVVSQYPLFCHHVSGGRFRKVKKKKNIDTAKMGGGYLKKETILRVKI